jgi:hypothetical protein
MCFSPNPAAYIARVVELPQPQEFYRHGAFADRSVRGQVERSFLFCISRSNIARSRRSRVAF